MKDIVLLDLFSGIGGFTRGLIEAGFNIKTHYFSEIDKHAIAIYKYQFKDSIYAGDVTTLDGRSITRPNIITFGSPCQDFSVAGKRAGLEGQRSSLIGQAIRLIAECRPDFFIWENVKGVFSSNNGEDFWAVIQAFTNIGGYRLEWQLLNTSWFLPQNRERIYLVGHLAKPGRDFQGIFPIGCNNKEDVIVQGQSTNTIKARYEANGDGSYIIENKLDAQINIVGHSGSGGYHGNIHGDGLMSTLTSTDYKQPKQILVEPTHKHGEERTYDDIAPTIQSRYGTGGDNVPYVVSHYGHKDKEPVESEIVPTLKAESHGHEPMIVAQRGREEKCLTPKRTEYGKKIRKQYESGEIQEKRKNIQQLEPRQDGVTNTLTGVQKDNLVIVGNIYESGGQNGNVYDTNGISPSISSGETSTRGNGGIGSSNAPKIMEDFYPDRIREFNECPTLRGDRHGLKVANTVTPDAYLTKGERNRDENGKAILTSMNERRIRRLTEIECERLQGFPDNFTEYGDYDGVIKKVAKTQRYKALGNAVTVAVVKAVALRIKELFI